MTETTLNLQLIMFDIVINGSEQLSSNLADFQAIVSLLTLMQFPIQNNGTIMNRGNNSCRNMSIV